MHSSALNEQDEWAMSARRERVVMRDVPKPAAKARPTDDGDFRLPTARGVLSKAEIQALLRPDIPTINDDQPVVAETPLNMNRDFAAREKVSDPEGRRMAARLSLVFGQVAGLKAAVTSSARLSFETFAETRASKTSGPGAAFVCFGFPDGEVTHVLSLSARLAGQLVSGACGGRPDETAELRGLSAIDCALLEQLIAPIHSVFSPDVRIVGIETERDYVAALMASEDGEEFSFNVRSAGTASSLQLIRLKASPRPVGTGNEALRKKPVTAVLTARIASLSVPVSKVSALKPGDTLLLGLPADQPVELLSGGRDGSPAFEGQVGRKGNRMAVKIRRRSTF